MMVALLTEISDLALYIFAADIVLYISIVWAFDEKIAGLMGEKESGSSQNRQPKKLAKNRYTVLCAFCVINVGFCYLKNPTARIHHFICE